MRPGKLAVVTLMTLALVMNTTPVAGASTVRNNVSAKLNLMDPRSLATPDIHRSAPSAQSATPSQTRPPGRLRHPVPMPMQPGSINLDPLKSSHFLGSDGRFEVDVPEGAVDAADVTAAGGQLTLSVRQIAPASGGTGGGSGQYSFGTYLVQTVTAQKHEWNQALRKPLSFKLHVSTREQAFDLSHVAMTFNGAIPADTNFNPDPSGPVINSTQANLGKSTSVQARFDGTHSVLIATSTMPTDPLVSFNTDSPDARFGRPDIFKADLSAGALSASYPIDVPPGPGGLTPPIALAYNSAALNEQHNPQGAAPWVGEGWNLGMGSIDWAEHNLAAGCQVTGACTGPNFKDSWVISDPYGTTGDLIPPNTQVKTYYDDMLPSTITATPVQWHMAPESHAKIFEYTGSFGLPGEPVNPPCFRVFLPSGIMEEFGCSTDNGVQPVQYWPWASGGNFAVNRWLLDLIADPQGNQIHLNYQVDTNTYAGKSYPRDIVLSSIEWDDPTCHSAQARCATWNPLMRVNFAASHSVAHVSGSSCAANGNLRCDDPVDLSGSSGMTNPLVQNTFVLNDVQVQTRASSSASWNSLRNYQLSYDQGGPTTVRDPATGNAESVAGKLTLTQMLAVGDDGTTTLPARTFGYASAANWYTDEAYRAASAAGCGPGFNSTNCYLWSRSYDGNSFYLTSASNGLGLAQSFGYGWARNNTHGPSTDPFACSAVISTICNKADSQNWSRILLTQESGSLIQAGSTLTTTKQYAYTLASFSANPCSDCLQGYTWGNQKDGDYADYYNAQFMGFAQVTVTNPDGSLEVHKYHSTLGWGVYNCSEISCAADGGAGTTYCYSACHSDPWWPLAGQSIVNALHGREYEADYYDTNRATLLKKTVTTYATGSNGVQCPPTGISGSPASGYGNWDGQLVSELDPSNPVATCDLNVSQVDNYVYDGSSANGIPHRTTSFTYDSYGRVASKTEASNDGGANASATTIVNKPLYVSNDNVSATSTSATGTYLINFPAFADSEDASSNRYLCTYTSYDGQPFTTGQTSGLSLGEPTRVDRNTSCGTAANGFTPSGQISETRSYDVYGNLLTTNDPDANAGNGGHLGCILAGSTATFSRCNGYDGTFAALPISTTNALKQSESTAYQSPSSATASGGFGLWPISITDPNNQTTSYSYDALGRPLTETLPGEQPGFTTVSMAYTDWCSGTGAQSPCVEMDRTQTLGYTGPYSCHPWPNCTPTVAISVTERSFYDGWGHLVETRVPAPSSQDVVHYFLYDKSGRLSFESVEYFVPAYSGSPGSAAYATPDATKPGTSNSYDGLGRLTTSKDALSNQATNSFSVVCSTISGDNACYEQTLTVDPLNHQSGVLVDAFERQEYGQRYTGNTPSTYAVYATTKYTYDYQGSLTQILHPDGTTKNLFQYDAAGRRTGMTDPDLGTVSFNYDQDGNLVQSVDARGTTGTIFAGYDGLDRQLWRNSVNSASGAYATFGYDSTTNGNVGIGRLTSEAFTGGPNNALSGSDSYVYDGRGRQTSSTLTVGGASYTVQNYYDDAGNITQQTYPDGEAVKSAHTNQGWLSSVSSGATTLMSNATYAENEAAGQFGGPARRLTGASLGGGAYQYGATYDALLRASDLKWTNGAGSTTFFDQARTFDGASNVISANTTLPSGTDNQVFCYDEQNRLTWAGTGGNPSCGTPIQQGTLSGSSYSLNASYDNLGRMVNGPTPGTYTYGDPAHLHALTAAQTYVCVSKCALTSSWTATYDAAGHMTCRAPSTGSFCSSSTNTGAQLSYDAEGRLVAWQNAPTSPTTTAGFLYDNQGNRVEQQVTQSGTTTTTVYVGNLEQVSTTGTSTTTMTYYYAGSARIAEAVNGVFSYLAADGLGSANVALDPNGNVTASVLYKPYGGVRYSNGTMPTDYGFTGQRADNATGLDYYNARYYDPVAGQFISADVILPGGGYDIWGLSRYAYVEGNPVARTDPSGNLLESGGAGCDPANCEPDGGVQEVTGSGVVIDSSSSAQPTPQELYQAYKAALGTDAVQRQLAAILAVGFQDQDPVAQDLTEEQRNELRFYAGGGWLMDQARAYLSLHESKLAELFVYATILTSMGSGAAKPQRNGSSDDTLYHGTDLKSANDIVDRGINRAAASEKGGGDVFWTTSDIKLARIFARANPALSNETAVVRIRLQGGIKAAIKAGILKPTEVGYQVTNWAAFNGIAEFEIAEMLGEEP